MTNRILALLRDFAAGKRIGRHQLADLDSDGVPFITTDGTTLLHTTTQKGR